MKVGWSWTLGGGGGGSGGGEKAVILACQSESPSPGPFFSPHPLQFLRRERGVAAFPREMADDKGAGGSPL